MSFLYQLLGKAHQQLQAQQLLREEWQSYCAYCLFVGASFGYWSEDTDAA